MPNHCDTTNVGMPDSTNVGTWGRIFTRFAAVTASARILPDFTCGCADSTVETEALISPEMRLMNAAPEPLNSTCCMSTPAVCLNSSAVMCGLVPTPGEPNVSCPGLALASAMSSFTLFAGTAALTVMICTASTTHDMGAKSRTAS